MVEEFNQLMPIKSMSNKYFKDQLFKEKIKEREYSGKRVPIGVDKYYKTIYYIDMNEAFRMIILGMTRSGKTWLMRGLNDRSKKIGFSSLFIPDVKDEFGTSIEPVQQKFRKYLLDGEIAQGNKVVAMRPTFFKSIRGLEKPKSNTWLSVKINEITQNDFLTLVGADKLTLNQQIAMTLVYEKIEKRGGLNNLDEIDEIIDDIKELANVQKNALKFKFKTIRSSHFFDLEQCHDIIKAINMGISPAINMERFEDFGRTGSGLPQVFVSMILRKVINARRNDLISKINIFIDEASRFVPAEGNPTSKIDIMECLFENTKMYTNYGIKKIKDLNKNKDKVMSYDFDKDLYVYTKFIPIGNSIKEVYEVTLKGGETVKCSLNHKFFVKDKNDIIVKMLKDINVGDFILFSGVECQICGKIFRDITCTHLKKHNITLQEYHEKYPNHETRINYIATEKTKEKISASNKGKKTWNKGIKRKPETIKKIKETIKNRTYEHITPEWREKASKRNSGENNPNYGNRFNHTNDTKKQISNSLKKRYKTDMGKVTRSLISDSSSRSFDKRLGRIEAKIVKKKISDGVKDFYKIHPDKLEQLRNRARMARFIAGLHPNEFEKYCINELQKNNLEFLKYSGDGTIWINNGNPDFIDKDNKLIVEVYHKYWKYRIYVTLEKYKTHRQKQFNEYTVLFFDMENVYNGEFIKQIGEWYNEKSNI